MPIDPTNLDPLGVKGFSTTGIPEGLAIQDIGTGTGTGPLRVILNDTGGNYVAAGSSSFTTIPEAFVLYQANTGGTGYVSNDIIARILTVTNSTTSVSYWANVTQNTVLATPPTIGNLNLLEGAVSGTVTANAGTGFPSTTTAGSSGTNLITVQGSASGVAQPISGTVAVSGTVTTSGTSTVSGTVTANAGTGTFAVSAGSLPLPTGAATAAKQAAPGTAGSASADVVTVQGIASMTALKVDNSGVTQPISGTVTANAGSGTFTVSGTVTANAGTGTLAVSAASLPLPTGAATAAKQPALGTAGSASTDVITVQGIASGTAQPVSGTVTANAGTGTFTISGTVTANAGTGTLAVSAASLPLPTGASTAAKQPALGTAGSASTDVLSVQGIASMTALKVDGSAVTQPVSGTITANAGTGTFAVSAASLPLPSGASTAAKQPALGTAGSASTDVLSIQGIASMTALKVDPSAVTSPVSAASLPLPTGASTSAKQPALGTAGSASTDVLSVQGIASMTALKVDGSAVTQPVSGTVTANAGSGTLAVSIATAPALVASTAHIGNVGGTAAKISVTPTISTSAYANKYVVGGLLTFSSAFLTSNTGYVQSVRIVSKSVQTAGFILYLFETNPTNSTWTDHATAAINASDLPFLAKMVPLTNADSNLGTCTLYTYEAIGALVVAASTTLYGVLVTTGTPTFTGTTDITITVTIDQN